MNVADFCEHVRTRCTRAQPLEGRVYQDRQIVVCPSWEEKEKLEGKGVLPLHADEVEMFATSPDITGADKSQLCNLMLRFSGLRLLSIDPTTKR